MIYKILKVIIIDLLIALLALITYTLGIIPAGLMIAILAICFFGLLVALITMVT